jgi:hypothetical protein
LAPGYGTITLWLITGEVVRGRYDGEDATGLSIKDDQGQTQKVRRQLIEARRFESAMPSGLHETMTKTEFRDLIAYLLSLT